MISTYDWFIARCKAVINHSKPPEPPMRVRLHEAGHQFLAWRLRPLGRRGNARLRLSHSIVL